MIPRGAIPAWKSFQDKSPYFQAVKADGEESLWKEIAPDYDSMVYPNNQKEIILSKLIPHIRGAKTAIEIGAGPGTLTIELSKYFENLTVIEPSPSMIGVLKQQLNGNCVSVLQSKWEDAHPEPADMIIAGGCLYAFYDIDKVLLKMLKYATSKVLITHIGNEGLWGFEYRFLEKTGIAKPCLFPPLWLIEDILKELNLSVNTDIFSLNICKTFTPEQWLRRCQRFFQFQDTEMIIGFLQDEFQHDPKDIYTIREQIPAALIEISV